jgi:hypothetical protein
LADEADLVFDGRDADNRFGAAVAAGDVNGDGRVDILVGAPSDDAAIGTGRAYLFYGSFEYWPLGDVQLADASAIIDGEDANDRLGYRVAAIGDVNCDGVEDFALGAHYADEVESYEGGGVYIFLGPTPHSTYLDWQSTGSFSAADADVIIYGDTSGMRFGAAITGLGDFDGDGCDDFAVGAPGAFFESTQGGIVFVYTGDTSLGEGDPGDPSEPLVFNSNDFNDYGGVALYGTAALDWFGTSLAAGDFDSDGYPDLVVGASYYDPSPSLSNAGAAYLFLGGPGEWAGWTPASSLFYDCLWTGTQANAHAGYSVLAGFDFDGDGSQDIAVGEPDWDAPSTITGPKPDTGRVFMLYPSETVSCSGGSDLSTASDVIIRGTTRYNRFGLSLAAGDVNPGDTTCAACDDLLVGAPSQSYPYAAWIPGDPSLAGTQTAPAGGTLLYSSTETAFGWSVAVLNVNGVDGADVVVGAPYDSTNGHWAGAAHYWMGNTVSYWKGDGSSHLASTDWTTFYGEDVADYAGWAVSSLGDLNQDGEPDLGVGAWGETYGIGTAYVVLSSY